MESIKAISPEQARSLVKSSIPSEVFEIVNDMLVCGMRTNSRVILYQDDIMDEIIKVFQKRGLTISRIDVFSNGWLNFEPHYREAGWTVGYDGPGFNEDYKAHFIFTART